MTKQEYINKITDTLIQFWLGLAFFFGAFFFIVLSLMDYIATPENFMNFLKYRLLGAFVLTVIIILNRKKVNRRYQIFLLYIGSIIAAIIIEYMILNFGGHSSTYYAGFFIYIMVLIGFIPLDLKHSISLSIIGFVVYAMPILIFDKSFNINYFLIFI
jgi:hypothetical protein